MDLMDAFWIGLRQIKVKNMSEVNEFRNEAYDQVVKIGKTLGNVSRLKILDNLVQSKKSVEELARAVGLSIGTTSKNLQLLKKVNLVKEEKEKNFVFLCNC